MTHDPVSIFVVAFVFILLMTPFAFGAFLLAEKLDENRWVWAVLALIPGVNALFGMYVMFCLVFHVVDSLGEVRSGLARFVAQRAPVDPE